MTVTLGVPGALALRAWRLRDRTPRPWRGTTTPDAGEEAAGATKHGWWRTDGQGAAADDAGPYDGEADFFPVGDPSASTQVDWHDSGAREVGWAAAEEGPGSVADGASATLPPP